MSSNKRISGDYNITAINSGTTATITYDEVVISGNLTVTGTSTEVESTDLAITDKTIVLNKGESGAGVTGYYSGIEIERGSATNTGLRWNDDTDKWQVTTDGVAWVNILTSTGSGTGLENVVEDLTPELGGNLDVLTHGIVTSTVNGDITLTPNGTGTVKIEGAELALDRLASDPTAQADYNLLYHKTEGSGGTGLYFKTTTTADELVSKSKAIVYGIIF
jgi:hypothetical protein